MNPNVPISVRPLLPILFSSLALCGLSQAGLEVGNKIQVTLRGVAPDEQAKVTGVYRVREDGDVRLPLLDRPVAAKGLSPDAFARKVEESYIAAGVYSRPAIEVEAVEGKDQQGEASVSVGGQVRRAGLAPFRKGMTVIQAIDAAGGRTEFGGRNLVLIRKGRQVTLDFQKLEHKSLPLEPGDSIQVEQKGAVMDNWKGNEEAVGKLAR